MRRPDTARAWNEEGSGGASPHHPCCSGSFAGAFRLYYPRVFAFMLSLVRDAQAARAHTDRVFSEAYLQERGLRDAHFETWVFRLARSMAARGSTGTEDIEDRTGRVVAQDAGELMRHVAGLPRHQQELLALKFDALLPGPRIASVMGMTEAEVRVCVYRALKKLHGLMSGTD